MSYYIVVISTEASLDYYKQTSYELTEDFKHEVERAVHELERQTGKHFGSRDPKKSPRAAAISEELPLLLSVRSDASVETPGIMETILNLGMNQDVVQDMLKTSNNPRWVFDTYRRFSCKIIVNVNYCLKSFFYLDDRFLQMFGTTVCNINPEAYETILSEARRKKGVDHDSMLDESDLISVVQLFKALCDVPDCAYEQLRMAIKACMASWFSERAAKYRDIHNIPDDLGTGIVVQAMVYGNRNAFSGSGIAYTR